MNSTQFFVCLFLISTIECSKHSLHKQEKLDKTRGISSIACKTDEDCYNSSLDSGPECVEYVCMCNGKKCSLKQVDEPEKTPRKSTSSCDQNCQENDANSECSDGICVCIDGYESSPENSSCIPASNDNSYTTPESLESECKEDQDCHSANTYCKNGTCDCQEGYHKNVEGDCIQSLGLGDPCEEDGDCSNILYSKCSEEKKCACIDHHKEKDSQCYRPVPKTTLNCTIDEDCHIRFGGRSFCHDGTCECQEGYEFELASRSCVEIVGPGSSCKADEDCDDKNEEGEHKRMECVNNMCVCRPAYFLVQDTCLSSASATTFNPIILLVTSILASIWF